MNKKPFYLNDEVDEQDLFENSLIFFDTSSLLDMFYFTEENIEELEEKIFVILKDRLWITNQSQFEFLKNKEKVKLKPIDTYNSLVNKVKGNSDSGHIEEIESYIKVTQSKITDELRGQVKTLQEKVSKNNKHPHLKNVDFSKFNTNIHNFEKQVNEFKINFESFKKELIEDIEEQKKKFKNTENDIILPILEKYFAITSEPKYNLIEKYIQEGEFRYRNQIPPGYLDYDNKIGFQKYGDLIVWKEILAKAKKINKNIILVINDVKEDWWHLNDKKENIAPRYELLKEFSDFTGHKFWMYEIGDFLFKANKYLSSAITTETIEEIKTITEEIRPNDLSESFIDWIFEYFEMYSLINSSNLTPLYDYILEFQSKESALIIHKKINSSSYTRLMFPIRTFIEEDNNEDILEDLSKNIRKKILLLEYDNIENLKLFDRHINNKKTLRTLIKKFGSDDRLIVLLNINDNYSVYFDSDK